MRTKIRCAGAVALATIAACGGSTGGSAGASSAEGATNEARSSVRIVVVSHGQSSDPFWSVVANGITDAAEDLGVRVEYQAPTSFDMVRMSELIDAAVASRPSALIVSIPDPAALGGSIRAAIAANVPTFGINSGADAWEQLGLLGYLGQTEYEAGVGAGERLGQAGAKKVLCVNHEVGNVSLDERCRGLADGLKRTGATTTVLAVELADPDDAQQRVTGALSADAALDGILTLGPGGAAPTLAAVRSSGRPGSIHFGTFDLEADVLRAVANGEMLFAIDQQPYLQGYLAVVVMTKYLESGTMPGGGDLIRTGPSFVTRENAADVIRLTEQGIR
ncbi:MAG: sugar ABC transporter substrate-binding protein [Longimicrobiales bacterium]